MIIGICGDFPFADSGSLLMRTELASSLVGLLVLGWLISPASAASIIGVLVLEGTLEFPLVFAPDLIGWRDLHTSVSVGNLSCQGYRSLSGGVRSSQVYVSPERSFTIGDLFSYNKPVSSLYV